MRVGAGLELRSSRVPQSMSYSRFTSRRPTKIIMPTAKIGLKEEKIIELDRSGKPKPLVAKKIETRTTKPYYSSKTDDGIVTPTDEPSEEAHSDLCDVPVAETKTATRTNLNKYDRKKKVGFNARGGTQVLGNENDNVFDSDGNVVYFKLKNEDSNIGLVFFTHLIVL